MKRWKLIVLTAILCMTVGSQAFAAEESEPAVEESGEVNAVAAEKPGEVNAVAVEKPGEVNAPVAGGADSTEKPAGDADSTKEPAENTDSTDTSGGGSGGSTTNLPTYEFGKGQGDDSLNIDAPKGSTVVCNEGDVTLQMNGGWDFARFVPSKRSISQEEAQEIRGTTGTCKVEYIGDIKMFALHGKVPNDLSGKTITGVKLKDGKLNFMPDGSSLGNFIVGLNLKGREDYINEVATVVYYPAGSNSYIKLPIANVHSDAEYMIVSGLTETIPLEGATIAVISSDPSEKTSGSSSDSSEEPEVYSHGASVGGVGVQKSGVAAQVIKANGEETWTVVHPYVAPGTRSLTQTQAQALLGTRFACSVYSFDLSIVDAAGDYSQVTLKGGNVPVTFSVPGVTPESKVALRHWIHGGNTYEDLPVEVGNGSVTARFTSFSPVVIVVEQPGVTAAAGTGNTPVSPRTGDSPVLFVAEAAALLSLLGLSICRRRRQA